MEKAQKTCKIMEQKSKCSQISLFKISYTQKILSGSQVQKCHRANRQLEIIEEKHVLGSCERECVY